MKNQAALLLTPSSRRLHPLVAAAAVTVIALCAAGIAALTGLLPAPWARDQAPQAPVLQQDAAAVAPAPSTARAAAGPASAAAPRPAGTRAGSAAPIPAAQASCPDCGTIETIREIRVPVDSQGNAILGTVAGGVVGGVVGNQFGGGSGRTALTVLGAVGGALAGREIERNIREQQTVTRYEMTVRMDDGSARKFYSDAPFMLASGDHVRIENGRVLPR